MRNERRDIATDLREKNKKIKVYCEQLYSNKLGNILTTLYAS